MLQHLLPLLSKDYSKITTLLMLAGAIVGVGLWLFGSRFSRTLVSLVLVSVGGWFGLFLPRWFGWSIEGWATAVGGALVLGISGFLLHRFWIGVGLGVIAVAWAAILTWTFCSGDAAWVWPKLTLGTHAWPYLQDIWANLPTQVQKILPFSCGAAFLSGCLYALIWPRLGVATFYSLTGVSMMTGLGLSALYVAKPEWLDHLPGKTYAQGLTLLGMVVFGALLQWKIAPKKKPAKRKPLELEYA